MCSGFLGTPTCSSFVGKGRGEGRREKREEKRGRERVRGGERTEERREEEKGKRRVCFSFLFSLQLHQLHHLPLPPPLLPHRPLHLFVSALPTSPVLTVMFPSVMGTQYSLARETAFVRSIASLTIVHVREEEGKEERGERRGSSRRGGRKRVSGRGGKSGREERKKKQEKEKKRRDE